MRRKPAPPPQATIHECSRCSKIHHGSSTPPGWSHSGRHGLLCDDCCEALSLSAITGIRHRAAA